QAKQNYTQALTLDPSLNGAANNLASILADQGQDLTVALNLAQSARKGEAENAAYADTLGWIQHKLGSNILARDQLRFAVSKDPDNPLFQYHLGVIYADTRQIAEAQTALKRAINNPKSFSERERAEAALREISKPKEMAH